MVIQREKDQRNRQRWRAPDDNMGLRSDGHSQSLMNIAGMAHLFGGRLGSGMALCANCHVEYLRSVSEDDFR